MRNILFFIFIATLCFSCQKDNVNQCFKKRGDIIVEERSITSFHTIDIKDNINLIIQQDSSYSIKVEAGENLLPFITTTVRQDTLFIYDNNQCNWLRNYKEKITIHLSIVDLKKIICRGSGNIQSKDTLRLKELKVLEIENSSDITLTLDARVSYFYSYSSTGDFLIFGTSKYNYLYSAGYGKFDFRYFSTISTTAINKRTNDFYVNVSNTLDVTIEGIGNIYYKGDSLILNSNITGEGKLIKF